MDHVHVKSRSSSNSKSNNTTKVGCEKASRRLRTILVKASRLGVSTSEVAGLPAAKKLFPQKDHGWRLAVFLLLMFAGGVIVALVCTTRRGCSKLEDILRVNSINRVNRSRKICVIILMACSVHFAYLIDMKRQINK
ncbi:hypothetical protein HZH68_015138 [Vespula germanica]|uniref:Transmembrane protein n=1 Tax=Vespula germanica TaxID=30212 RepID=A0A834J7L8_VESGE|nr:hypothetical protein HZH68_015138 [Vespula germanica]